jgi:hypothetical protein
MWPFVPPNLGSEPFVLFTKLLILLAKLLNLLFKRSKACEYLFAGRSGRGHERGIRDGLRAGDHPSRRHLFACCIDLLR